MSGRNTRFYCPLTAPYEMIAHSRIFRIKFFRITELVLFLSNFHIKFLIFLTVSPSKSNASLKFLNLEMGRGFYFSARWT